MTGQKFIPRADHVGSLLRPDSVRRPASGISKRATCPPLT